MKTEFELAVLKAFGTYSACEKFMKWSSGTISKIVSGRRSLKDHEIDALAEKFKIKDYDEFRAVFFNGRLPNGNNKSA